MQLFLSQCWVTGFSHDDGWTGCLSSAGYWKWGKQILFCHGRPLMTWAASCTVSQAGWGPFLHLSPQSEGNDTGEPRGGSWRARHLHLPSQESCWPTHTQTHTYKTQTLGWHCANLLSLLLFLLGPQSWSTFIHFNFLSDSIITFFSLRWKRLTVVLILGWPFVDMLKCHPLSLCTHLLIFPCWLGAAVAFWILSQGEKSLKV